jgi:maltose O-acetyltransferase
MRVKYEFILWINEILKIIPGQIGCKIRNVFLPYKNGKKVKVWNYCHIDSPSKLIIGSHVSINRGCIINAGGNVVIGNDVLIGPKVIIYSQNHQYKDCNKLIREQGYTLNKVTIGNNVWIASGVTILPGVSIGDNCVIGANSVITKSIPSNSLVVGNPGKVMKKLKS